jgi:hypothetical protein
MRWPFVPEEAFRRLRNETPAALRITAEAICSRSIPSRTVILCMQYDVSRSELMFHENVSGPSLKGVVL